jgi:predicted acylesterase/phospholipase RssA/CRP-like cAMP-binding protein
MLHPCAQGLDAEALEEIAASAELVRCQPGDAIHRAGEAVTAVYLVIHGRVRVTITDDRGRTIMARYQGGGGQLGGLAAALGEGAPMDCVAEDPSTLLKIAYARCLELTRTYSAFRVNFARTIADAVKQTIYDNRLANRPRFVALLHQSDATRVVSQELFRRLVSYGERLGVFTDWPGEGSYAGVEVCQIFGGDRAWSVEDVRRQAAQWLDAGRVFADAATAIDPARAVNALDACELVFWCVTPQNWRESTPRLQELVNRAPRWRDKVRVLWLLAPSETAPLAEDLRRLSGQDVKISLHGPGARQGRVVSNGLSRLVQLVRGIQIGIALGGGAARGMAHLGVLKALEQHAIAVDMIAGTSAGAMTGVLYAAGLNPDYLIERFVHDLTPTRLFRHLPRGDQWYLLYKYRMRRFDPMLRKYLGDVSMEQLWTPMHTVTVDLIGGVPVVRSSGDAVHAILESINLPVLSHPIYRPGQALVDGGLINNIPADVLVKNGCNFVIAISVTAKMGREFARNRPDTPISKMRPASVIQTMLRSFLVQSTNINALGVQPANIVIEPDVSAFELTAFSRTDELAAVGEAATLSSIDEIKALLHRLDGKLFP